VIGGGVNLRHLTTRVLRDHHSIYVVVNVEAYQLAGAIRIDVTAAYHVHQRSDALNAMPFDEIQGPLHRHILSRSSLTVDRACIASSRIFLPGTSIVQGQCRRCDTQRLRRWLTGAATSGT
jgi:hypothetical protein